MVPLTPRIGLSKLNKRRTGARTLPPPIDPARRAVPPGGPVRALLDRCWLCRSTDKRAKGLLFIREQVTRTSHSSRGIDPSRPIDPIICSTFYSVSIMSAGKGAKLAEEHQSLCVVTIVPPCLPLSSLLSVL